MKQDKGNAVRQGRVVGQSLRGGDMWAESWPKRRYEPCRCLGEEHSRERHLGLLKNRLRVPRTDL